MGYLSWFNSHGKQHREIIDRLKDLSDDEVIEYFRFENMVKNEPDFCPLYAKNRKCHNIEDLNCYLCACPNFRFNDNGLEIVEDKTLFSICSIKSKDGKQFISSSSIHQDCSDCLVPHRRSYIKNNFSRDWFAIMKSVKFNLKGKK